MTEIMPVPRILSFTVLPAGGLVAAFSALETEGKMYYNLIEIYNREVFDEHTRNA